MIWVLKRRLFVSALDLLADCLYFNDSHK